MPARSEAQRRYLYHKFGPAWAKEHHFDNKGQLPAHAPKAAVQRRVRRTHKKA
jgi:hypothetical protein